MPAKRAVVRGRPRGKSIEDAPLTPFHQRLTVYSSGGPFLDGYTLSIIGVALTQLGPQLNLGPIWSGLIGASALVGLFIGGFFGYLTDLVGRQVMYTIDLMVFIVGSVLQMFIVNAPELFVLRLILGIAVGADYPIATSLLAEFAPKKYRGGMLGMQILAWYIGATAAYIVGGLLAYYGGINAWRWMLGSSAVPALILVFMRWGTPESPRWLMSKGRHEDWIYPNEIFPTEVRGTAVGIATSISRVGKFSGPLFCPLALPELASAPQC